MKLVSKPFLLITLSAVALFAGCTKKPVRPDPSSTVLGPDTGGKINPTDVPLDPNAGLAARLDGDFDPAGQNRTALASSTVYFEFNQSSIRPAERTKLDAAKEYLAKNPTQRLLLEGHCDWRGTSEYNLGLGDRRAAAVKKYLITSGIAADKLETISKGSEEAKKNGSEEDMKKDRRVDVIVVKAP